MNQHPYRQSEMIRSTFLLILGFMLGYLPRATVFAERINQEGRILGPAPAVTNATLFNTPEADAVVAAMQIFPVTNPWNEDISRRPRLVNSEAMIAQIVADLSSSRRTLRAFFEMNYVLVPDDQPSVPVNLFNYPDESDPSPYPVPANLPVETWPRETGSLTLEQWQRDVNNDGGDRHAIIVQPGTGGLWETWLTRLVDTHWEASNGAKFNLTNNQLRPLTWTSADAAGLAMFPALVRYDECERGMVEHACRLVVKRTRRQFIYPATHYASTTDAAQTNVPAMGQRLRLKAAFVIPENWTQPEQAVLRALKKYGAIVADNGGFFSISVTPDQRWMAGVFDHLSSLSVTNFEVIQSTGENEGPRSPGAPTADAGPDFLAPPDQPVQLNGWVEYVGAAPGVLWKLYSGPGEVSFSDPRKTNAQVNFTVPGEYTLMLSADDGIHAVAFDAVVVTVSAGVHVAISRAGNVAAVAWSGGTPPYVIETSKNLPATSWQAVMTTAVQRASLTVSGPAEFIRLKAQSPSR
jgi:hypothetical protein